MNDEIARQLAAVKVTVPVSPESSAAVRNIYLPFQEREPYRDVAVLRDEQYGPDERHRVDIFAPLNTQALRPVMLFVHGGAYVAGDKRIAGTPYHDNVGLWAARRGFVGVTMTYRLAPRYRYPAGAEDVGTAVAWLRSAISAHGGDPGSIALVGHSAGATHVASYVARNDPGTLQRDLGVSSIVLMAGSYEFSNPKPMPHVVAYFGEDPSVRSGANTIPGVVASGLPVMLVISEFDSAPAHRQTKLLADELFAREGRFPNLVYLPRHNHVSQLSHLNATGIADNMLSDHLAEFIGVHTAQPTPA